MYQERVRPRLSSARSAFSVLDNDASLLAAAQAGDRSALAFLLTRHEAALLRLCGGILGGASGSNGGAEAADAVQETFLRAIRVLMKPNAFRGESSVRTYLFRIAIHVCLEWQRRPDHFSLAPEENAQMSTAVFPSTEQAVLERLRIADALRGLLPRHRMLLILREQEGYSAREIGELMGWNEKRVCNELFKMRQQLLRWRREEENGGER